MFNNPYNMYPYINQGINMARGIPTAGAIKASKGGFFKSLSAIKWGSILNNTQKTLNVINQAIPIIYQVKPLVSNARTLFRIADAVNEPESNNMPNNNYQTTNQQEKSNLQFFL